MTGARVLAATVLVLALQASLEAQEVVIKMATLVPDGSRWHLILKETAEKWRTLSAGRVVVRLYAGGIAGDDVDVVHKMRLGTLSAGLLTSVGLAEVDRSVSALELPLAYASYDEVYFVLERMRPRLEAGLAAEGFVVLNWADGGWSRFFTQKPVATPDDLRGLKLLTRAGDTSALEFWKAGGFDPVPLPAAEIGAALQTGPPSAVTVPPQVAVIAQYNAKARNMTDMPWQLLLGATLVTRSSWEKIPADLRPTLLAAAQDAGRRMREEMRVSGARDILEMKKRGLNVVAVDAKAKEAWRKTSEAILARARGPIVPEPAFDEALGFRAEYRTRKTPAR